MKIRLVSIDECADGDIISKDILNNNGTPIVVQNTRVNLYTIKKLISLGIQKVYIYDTCNTEQVQDNTVTVFEKYYIKYLDEIKNLINKLTTGEKLDIRQLESISESIGSKVENAGEIVSLLQVLKSADNYTYSHCINTAFYAMLIGKWMGGSQNEIKKLIQSGLIHDIGKVKVPPEILNKSDMLTKEEFEIIKQHTLWGYSMIETESNIDQDIKNAVLLHHERIDCSGYPFKASMNSVGINPRIIAVADVFDAMTSERVYKSAKTPFESFEMFLTVGVGMFDPDVVNVFLKNIITHFTGIKVMLNNGERGEIIYIPPQRITEPIILSGGRYIDLSKSSELKIQCILK